MRKLISIWVICTLLFITTLPTASLAAMCAIPQAASTTIETMANMQAMQHQKHAHKPTHIMHHSDAMAKADWQTCRIECGCGCHRHLDSLPHALSPHIIPQVADLMDIPHAFIVENYSYSQLTYVPMVQLPPPDLS